MIRVELIDPRGHFIRSVDFQKDLIKVGRSLDCDLIVPDFNLDLEEISIRHTDHGYRIQTGKLQESLTGQALLRMKGYKVRITDLAYFAGERKVDLKRPAWVSSLIFLSVIILGYVFEQFILNPYPHEVVPELRSFSALLVAGFILILSLSFISRAVNGEYRIWSISNTFFLSVIGFLFLSTDLFGVRWLMPSLFWRDPVWSLLLLLWGTYSLWLLSKAILDHISAKIRATAVLGLFFLLCVIKYLNFFPGRESFQYAQISPKPPVLEAFESRPIDEEQFLQDLKSLF